MAAAYLLLERRTAGADGLTIETRLLSWRVRR